MEDNRQSVDELFKGIGEGGSGASPSPSAPQSVDKLFEGVQNPKWAPEGEAEASPSPLASGPLSTAEHLAALTSQGLASGFHSSIALAPRTFDQLFETYVRPHLPEALAKSVDTPESKEFVKAHANDWQPPTPEQVEAEEASAGLRSAKPEGLGENLLAAGARGLGGAVAGLPFGGAAGVAPQLLAGSAGGLASEGAKAAGLGPGAQFIAGLVPALAVGNWSATREASAKLAEAHEAASAAEQTALQAHQAWLDARSGPEVQAAGAAKAEAQRAGDVAVDARLAARAPGNPLTAASADASAAAQAAKLVKQDLGQKFSEAQAASANARDSAIADAQAEALKRQQAADAALSELADAHGTSRNFEEAGENLQSAANALHASMPQRLGEIWAGVDSAIPKDAPGSLSNYRSALDSIAQDAGGLEPLAAPFTPGLARTAKRAADTALDEEGNIKPPEGSTSGQIDMLKEFGLDEPGGAAAAGAPPTWADMRKLRTRLGDALSTPEIVTKIGAQNLKRLYAGLSEDLRSIAEAHGAGGDFAQANTQSTSLYDLAEGPLSKVISGAPRVDAETILPGKMAEGLAAEGQHDSANLSRLAAAGVPVQELTSVMLRQGGAAADKWWGGLTPRAQAALVPDDAKREALGAVLAMHGDAQAEAERIANAARKAHEAEVAGLKLQQEEAEGRLGFGPETTKLRAAAAKQAQSDQNALLSQQQTSAQRASREAQASAKQLLDDLRLKKEQADLAARQAKLAVPAEPNRLAEVLDKLRKSNLASTAGALLGLIDAGTGISSMGLLHGGGSGVLESAIEGGLGGKLVEGVLRPAVNAGYNALVSAPGRAAIRSGAAGAGANVLTGR